MTGRELTIYILEHNLEDEPVFKDGVFVGFLTVDEAALKMGVGPATVNSWTKLGMLDNIWVDGGTYIPIVCKSVLGKDLNM